MTQTTARCTLFLFPCFSYGSAEFRCWKTSQKLKVVDVLLTTSQETAITSRPIRPL
jgi:hypothetical protein